MSLDHGLGADLTGRSDQVREGNHTSSMTPRNTGVPQGGVLSPVLFRLFTYDCTHIHTSNVIINFTNDSTIVGQLTGIRLNSLQSGAWAKIWS